MKKYLHTFIAMLLAAMLSACNEEKLLFNLTQEQANHVLAILQQHNVYAKKEGSLKTGYTVRVDKQESTAALSIINQYQLPWGAEVQIAQAFPDGALVASPNAEQARVLSLQEQRLEQSLRIISQVVYARVHVSYPPFNNDGGGKPSIGHVGVIITYKGEIETNMFISKIKSLIKNSFDSVSYENISVVLFPAPIIQYVNPTNANNRISFLWMTILSALVLCATTTAGYITYRFYYRPLVSKNKTNTPPEDEATQL